MNRRLLFSLIAGYFHDIYLKLLLRIDEESSQFHKIFTYIYYFRVE